MSSPDIFLHTVWSRLAHTRSWDVARVNRSWSLRAETVQN